VVIIQQENDPSTTASCEARNVVFVALYGKTIMAAPKNKTFASLQWATSVPIFRHPVIVRQLCLAIGLPFGILVGVLCLVADDLQSLTYPLVLIGSLFFLTWLFIMVVWRGRYEVECILNGSGVRCRTQKSQARTNRIINGLTVFLGLLSGKPTVAGAGMLAQSRQDQTIRWKNIRKVRRYPKIHTILVHGGFAEHLALFCTPDNYQDVDDVVREQTGL
jgi:hypothetical protein